MEYAKKLYEEKKYKRALLEFLKEEVAEEEYHELAYYLGLCYCRLSEFDEALLYLEQVVTSSNIERRVRQCKFIIGYIHSKQQDFIFAEREFRRLLEGNENDHRLYSAISHCLLKQGKTDEARQIIEKGYALAPDNPQILNTLAFIMAEVETNKDELKKALIYAKKALEKYPQEASYLDTVGWIFFKMNEMQEAMMFLGKANNVSPTNNEIKEHLKIVYEKVNTPV